MHDQSRAVTHAIECLDEYLAAHQNNEKQVLRDKQVDVMQDLHDFLDTHSDEPHGYISLPTGVGKTVLFTELVKATNLRTLILMPTQGLLDQTEDAFQRFGESVDVGKVYAKEQNSDERITLATYASFVRHTKKDSEHINPDMYDLIILDEAHRALGDETRRALAAYDRAIQVGFTATEDYSEARRLQSILPTEIHKMTIREAIDHKLITPFVNVLVKTGVDISGVRITQTHEYDTGDLEKALNTGERNKAALRVYQEYFTGQKAMVFCNGVAHAEAVAEVFRAAGIRAHALSGKKSLREQQEAKEALGRTGPGSLDVITNDKLLAEGFDVPAVSVCLNLAPTLSQVRAQQRSGRALRLDPSDPNKVAYIVDFIDEDYQLPPVLFSDPRVGERAIVGVEKDDTIIFSSEDEKINIVHDVETITKMAHDFHERKLSKREYAPDGWLSSGQIAALYNTTAALVSNHLSLVDEKDDLLVRKCHSTYVKGKTKRKYYSPEVIKEFANFQGYKYVDFEDVFPRAWVVLSDFETDYPPRVARSMKKYTLRDSPAFWSDQSVRHNGVEYIAPKLQTFLDKASTPMGYWVSAQDLADKHDIDLADVEELSRKVAKKELRLANTFPLWCLDEDGNEAMYLFPTAYHHLDRELTRRASEPQAMQEGEVIMLRKERQKRADFEKLVQLFTEEPTRETPVLAQPKTSTELDALYAEFM